MINFSRYISIAILACILSDTANAAEFSISYKWCEKSPLVHSPSIDLKNTPKGTAKLDIKLFDTGIGKPHLYGKIDFKNQKVIACDELADIFTPLRPIPGWCAKTLFLLQIRAIDKDGGELSAAEYSINCPENFN